MWDGDVELWDVGMELWDRYGMWDGDVGYGKGIVKVEWS